MTIQAVFESSSAIITAELFLILHCNEAQLVAARKMIEEYSRNSCLPTNSGLTELYLGGVRILNDAAFHALVSNLVSIKSLHFMSGISTPYERCFAFVSIYHTHTHIYIYIS